MTLMPLTLRIALRNLRRNPRRSFYTIAAIAFGLLCLLVFQSLKVGLHREMVASTIGLDAGSLQIHARGYQPNLAVLKPLPDPAKVEAALRRTGCTAFARRLKTPALLLAGKESSSVLLSGIEPGREPRVTFIASKVVAGAYPAAGAGVLIGRSLAKALGVGVGDKLTLMAQSAFGRPVYRRFPIAGIYQSALASFDRSHVYLSLGDLQNFLDAKGVVTEIAARFPLPQVAAKAASLRRALPAAQYDVGTWQKIAPDVVQLISLNDATMGVLIVIVFAIVALGIVNTMSMVVFERFRELGILAAIGTSPGRLVAMIVVESGCLGLLAAAVGTLLGLAACGWLGCYGIDLTAFTSHNQYFATSHVLKAHLLVRDLVAANLITLATALVGGLYPAWKGARLEPARAVRHV